MKRFIIGTSAIVLAASQMLVGGVSASESSGVQTADAQEFVVVYTEGVSLDEARAAVAASGGTIVSENTDVGVATVTTTNADFIAATQAQGALEGAAGNRIVGDVPKSFGASGEARKADPADAMRDSRRSGSSNSNKRKVTGEPLAGLQWDMQQIGATANGSYRYEQGSRGVTVGIIDTGVDGSHPDIAPNFDAALSRNFTVDIPVDANGAPIDGPCEEEPDASCEDPADVDENGHGTHVASTIASPINGLGIAGVAPKVTIVNLRAGQDSGYFFLQESVNALTYAGRNGIDVVNMSYYVDPWLFNCSDHPADSPADQEEQRTIVKAMQRALDFARRHGVTLVSAAGNGSSDYTKVISDASSPDFADVPGEAAYVRDLLDPATCISMPSEGDGVISVSSTGPSTRKAYYSDYGNGYVDVAAPGGDLFDTPTNELDDAATVLAAYPLDLALANGELDENGEPVVPWVVKNCSASGVCAYYQYVQGTSMASPHAVGVAALIVSKYGNRDRRHGGLTLSPKTVERILLSTATETPCPRPRDFQYTLIFEGETIDWGIHTCEGGRSSNGFYGDGIVNALRAVK